MKNLCAILLSFFTAYAAAQTCPVDNWIRNNYTFDAQLLSLHEMLADTISLYKDTVVIPPFLTEKYAGLLSSVYNLKSQSTDSIFNQCTIHVYPDVSFNSIDLILDASHDWVKTYLLDSLISGNEVFDSITAKYGFRLTEYAQGKTSVYATITSAYVLNVRALESPLRKIEGIRNAVAYRFWTDGDDIELRFEDESCILTFSKGWGDCLAGCMNRHSWEFSVKNCQANFIRIYGVPFTSVKELHSKADLFYPNPVSGMIYFNEERPVEQVQFYTITGIPVAFFEACGNSLDVSSLQPGFYLIRLTMNAGIFSSGLIKIE